MPTIASSVIPIPINWDEFEHITLSSLKIRWNSPNLQRNGRQGQGDVGVDIYGEDDLGRNVGIQCKLTKKNSVDFGIIQAEISNAEKFQPPLAAYYLAVSAPNDAKIQREVRLYSQQRLTENKFPVGILFWEDIIQDLIKDINVFKMHYPQFIIDGASVPLKSVGNRLLSLLDLGYYGYHLNDWLKLLFGEFEDHQSSTSDFYRLVSILEECTEVIFNDNKRTELINLLGKLRDEVNLLLEGKEPDSKGWLPVTQLVNKIFQYYDVLQYRLLNKELLVFKIGHGIACWEFHDVFSGDDYKVRHQNILIEHIKKLHSDKDIPDDLLKIIQEYRVDNAAFSVKANTPNRIKSKVETILLSLESN